MSIFSISGIELSQPFAASGDVLATVYDLGGNLLWQAGSDEPDVPTDIIDPNFSGRHSRWRFKIVSNVANAGYSSTDEAAIGYDDSAWDTVTVPHDWSIYNDFRSGSPSTYEGGFLDGGDAWYRTSFELPEDLKTKRTLLYFEGVYMECKVFLNGELLGENHMGYDPFWFDVSDTLVEGVNVLAVFVRNRQPSSRWYSGSGIYRPVYLLGTETTSLAAGRLVVRAPALESERAGTVQTTVSGTLHNFGAAGSKSITARVLQNRAVKAQAVSTLMLKKGENSFSLTVGVSKPDLWDVLDPHLYEMQVVAGSTVLASTVFGYRYFKWEVDSGFWLNGKNIKLKGVCMHHDLGCIGAEANRSAMERQIDILLNMGCNAIRLTHNPFDAQFLELCRDKGVLLVEEFFDSWTKPKKTYDFGRFFADEYEEVIDNTLRRDINNPAIIMWSIGNEINRVSGYNATTVKPIVQGLIDAVKSRDATRPVTMGEDSPSMESSKVCMELLDVCGINYQQNSLSVPHGMGKPAYGSETTSALSSRGIYARDDTGFQCSSFDDDKVNWGSYAATALKAHMDSAYSGGLFVWTGFDYIGEPTPFNKFPAKSSYFGIVDLAGFPKDIYYMYQSRWTTAPMVHIVPMDWDSWTEGKTVPVWLYSNCDSVELFQDGVSLGKKSQNQIGEKYQFAYSVTFKKGTLLAKGYGPNGEDSATDTVQSSTGIPAALSLSAYKSRVDVTTDDLVFITCDVLDANGIRVAKASNKVAFTCTGGTVLGTDNGNAACVENMRGNVRSAFSGKCLCICRHDGLTGNLIVTASADGCAAGTVTVQKV